MKSRPLFNQAGHFIFGIAQMETPDKKEDGNGAGLLFNQEGQPVSRITLAFPHGPNAIAYTLGERARRLSVMYGHSRDRGYALWFPAYSAGGWNSKVPFCPFAIHSSRDVTI